MRAILVCLWLLSAATAQEQHVITAAATDRSTGKAVGGLTAEDLEIVQDGKVYRVTSVRLFDRAKDIVFIVDDDLPVARESLTAGIRIADSNSTTGIAPVSSRLTENPNSRRR
jgi:hypothetical protein